MDIQHISGLDLAIQRAGGSQSALARKLRHAFPSMRQSTVSGWTRSLVGVPAEYLEEIENITGVAPSLVRPDLKSILAR